ncbi:peptidyl-alpha-hydroxyglycine alpha-amidating lyase 2 isoform X1 [Lepeophtheirus salmonis]|uniref:peptidyl-alpha-hydroxyglycine alpha-amidating lyase 2 isoform X1 n=1 Tax=Lepeophtheirus salmonis TaxID=72036 RepID=UPI001AE7F40C|nr:peptidyl-alpha-hydroxyglycine alpha-amidating lyase 2-like [Lepeophtheirus salmonis]XP_040580683.1 peptidyl-alpha-hydroxyglycine alpha-amidating lyase 2-like [Lepeophtheirus salmonis]
MLGNTILTRLFTLCLVSSLFLSSSLCQNIDFSDLPSLLGDYDDEFISRNQLSDNEPTDDYSNLEDNYEEVPHPVGVYYWGKDLKLGQVSGVAVDERNRPVIFQRGPVTWNHKSFDRNYVLQDKTPIEEDTIMTLHPETGEILRSWGKDLFYMPHGIAVDSLGNTYVTDTGLHQVMRFPLGSKEPDLTLGNRFEPGNGRNQFCQPSSVAVSDITGDIFVADGYCNSRVMKFNKDGELLDVLDGDWDIIHSITLFEDENIFCIANRNGQTIECFSTGLKRPFGQKMMLFEGVGCIFGIVAKGTALVGVIGKPDSSGITIDTSPNKGRIIDTWGKNEGISQPHDLAISQYGDVIYVVEMDPEKTNKVLKFEVINRMKDMDLF